MQYEAVRNNLHHCFDGKDDQKNILDVFLSNNRPIDQSISQSSR